MKPSDLISSMRENRKLLCLCWHYLSVWPIHPSTYSYIHLIWYFSATPLCWSLLPLFALPAHSNCDRNCFLPLPRSCPGLFKVLSKKTQLTILGNERTRSYCLHLVMKPGMKTECFKSMTMASCCNQMQLWREADQNCVRMQFWTKMKTRPHKEKPNSCWVFTGFSPSLWKKPAQQPNRCFDRYVWKYYQGGKHKQLTEYQVHLSYSYRLTSICTFSAFLLLVTSE